MDETFELKQIFLSYKDRELPEILLCLELNRDWLNTKTKAAENGIIVKPKNKNEKVFLKVSKEGIILFRAKAKELCDYKMPELHMPVPLHFHFKFKTSSSN